MSNSQSLNGDKSNIGKDETKTFRNLTLS